MPHRNWLWSVAEVALLILQFAAGTATLISTYPIVIHLFERTCI